MACVVKPALLSFAAKKVSPKASIISGRKILWVRLISATGSSSKSNGKKRLTGDTARAATTDEVKALRPEARDLKEVVAEQTLELRLLKKSVTGDGEDQE
jgi:hypothetical protein